MFHILCDMYGSIVEYVSFKKKVLLKSQGPTKIQRKTNNLVYLQDQLVMPKLRLPSVRA